MWDLSLPEGLGKRGGFTVAFYLAYLLSTDISIFTVVLTLERLGRVREVPPRDRAVRGAGDEADHGGAPHHEAAELHRRPH